MTWCLNACISPLIYFYTTQFMVQLCIHTHTPHIWINVSFKFLIKYQDSCIETMLLYANITNNVCSTCLERSSSKRWEESERVREQHERHSWRIVTLICHYRLVFWCISCGFFSSLSLFSVFVLETIGYMKLQPIFAFHFEMKPSQTKTFSFGILELNTSENDEIILKCSHIIMWNCVLGVYLFDEY